jgi:HD superfamily phosphohydrolase YqeK
MDEYKDLNHFDMMIACILHDTFKNGYVDNHKTVASHASIAADEFYNTYVYHKYSSDDLKETVGNVTYDYTSELNRRVTDICNMIRTHMGQWSAVKPQTKAEKLVHLADYVVSRKCWDKFNEA